MSVQPLSHWTNTSDVFLGKSFLYFLHFFSDVFPTDLTLAANPAKHIVSTGGISWAKMADKRTVPSSASSAPVHQSFVSWNNPKGVHILCDIWWQTNWFPNVFRNTFAKTIQYYRLKALAKSLSITAFSMPFNTCFATYFWITYK